MINIFILLIIITRLERYQGKTKNFLLTKAAAFLHSLLAVINLSIKTSRKTKQLTCTSIYWQCRKYYYMHHITNGNIIYYESLIELLFGNVSIFFLAEIACNVQMNNECYDMKIYCDTNKKGHECMHFNQFEI